MSRVHRDPPDVSGFSSILVRRAAGALVAPAFIVGGVLVLRGEAEGGDGFAAAVAISLGVILRSLGGRSDLTQMRTIYVARYLAAFGAGLVALFVLVPALVADAPLQPLPSGEPPKFGVLPLSSVTAFDVAVALLVTGVVLAIVGSILREVEEE